jgi:metallo-beta-lactamase family protein
MKITFAGAAKTVTGSQTLVSHGSTHTLVDCGLYQGPKELRNLNWEKPPYFENVSSIILTHAHIDHSGLIPRWFSWGWKGKVYCTHATRDLLEVMLLDAAKLQEEDARFANKTKHSHHDPALPLYTTVDANNAIQHLHAVSYNEWVELSTHFKFQFSRASHILGSASVQIEFTENDATKVITFSGDIGGGHSDILKDAPRITDTNFIVLESTYGNRKLQIENREQHLLEIINKVFARGGTLVIPAFAVGRTQDLLFSIYQLVKSKKIPQIPIYLDSPMARKITKIYKNHLGEMKAIGNNGDIEAALSDSFFNVVESPDESMLLCMSDEPKVVLSASGMLQGGRILHHLAQKLKDPKSGVLFVGFQGAGTKGRLLQEGILDLRIHHKEIPVEAEIFTLDGYSAHADQSDLIKWVEQFRMKPEKIFLNHGEPEGMAVLADILKAHFQTEVIMPSLNETFRL